MKRVQTTHAPAAIGPYSQAIVTNNLVFCSGQIALSPTTSELIGRDVTEQTEQVMKNLQAVLTEAGSSFEKVVKTTCYLTDMNDFPAFNQVYEIYLGTTKPARATVGVAQLPKGALVEMELIAELNQ